jgi:hypothetical protein
MEPTISNLELGWAFEDGNASEKGNGETYTQSDNTGF